MRRVGALSTRSWDSSLHIFSILFRSFRLIFTCLHQLSVFFVSRGGSVDDECHLQGCLCVGMGLLIFHARQTFPWLPPDFSVLARCFDWTSLSLPRRGNFDWITVTRLSIWWQFRHIFWKNVDLANKLFITLPLFPPKCLGPLIKEENQGKAVIKKNKVTKLNTRAQLFTSQRKQKVDRWIFHGLNGDWYRVRAELSEARDLINNWTATKCSCVC